MKALFNLTIVLILVPAFTACGMFGDSGGRAKAVAGYFGASENVAVEAEQLALVVSPVELIQSPFMGPVQVTMSGPYEIIYRSSTSSTPADPTCLVGKRYLGSFEVGGANETVKIKAIGCKNMEATEVVSASYVFGPSAGLTVSPSSINQIPFSGAVDVVMSGASEIIYKQEANGIPSNPSCTSGKLYNGTFELGGPSETVTIKVASCNSGTLSPIYTLTYAFGAPVQPSLSPSSASQTNPIHVTISAPGTDKIMWNRAYVAYGPPADPTCTSGHLYSGPVDIYAGGPNEAVKLKVISCINGKKSNVKTSGIYIYQ